jgi:hypothetical protein
MGSNVRGMLPRTDGQTYVDGDEGWLMDDGGMLRCVRWSRVGRRDKTLVDDTESSARLSRLKRRTNRPNPPSLQRLHDQQDI